MKIGHCTSLENIGILEKEGYDFVELGVGTVLPEKSDLEFLDVDKKIKQYKIKPECFNGFLPGDLKITGPEIDYARIKKYVSTALKRVSLLGGEIVVFGSGGARKVPDGFNRNKALQQIKTFLLIVTEFAEKNNIKIAIEHLNKNETNILNTLKEAGELCEAINNSRIRLLLDMYHFNIESEPWGNLTDTIDQIIHIHVADTDRYYPGSGKYDFNTMFNILKKNNYQGRISCEYIVKDFVKDSEQSIVFLKEMINKDN